MAVKSYIFSQRKVAALPRSLRARLTGGGVVYRAVSSSSGGSEDSSGGSLGSDPLRHNHFNKSELDSLGVDVSRYLYVTLQNGDGTEDKGKAKAGYADTAGMADTAGYADTAGTADIAKELTEDSPTNDRFIQRHRNDTMKGTLVHEKQSIHKAGLSIGASNQASVDPAGCAVVQMLTTKTNGRVVTQDITTPNFAGDPIAGYGGRAWLDNDGQHHITTDILTVRRSMHVAVLHIEEYKASGGAIVVTQAAGTVSKVQTVYDSSGAAVYRLTIKDADKGDAGGRPFMPFETDDYVRCARWDYANKKYHSYWALVTGINGDYKSIHIRYSEMEGQPAPEVGDELVQMGNKTKKNRQGFIIITANNVVGETISVYAGVASKSLEGKLKARFGSLKDIVENGEALQGYGLWCDNAYLRGRFRLDSNGEDIGAGFVSLVERVGGLATEIQQTSDSIKLSVKSNGMASNILAQAIERPTKKSSWCSIKPDDVMTRIDDYIGFIFSANSAQEDKFPMAYITRGDEKTWIPLEAGKTYTLTWEENGDLTDTYAEWYGEYGLRFVDASNQVVVRVQTRLHERPKGEFRTCSHTFTVPQSGNHALYIIWPDTQFHSIALSHFMLVEGDIAMPFNNESVADPITRRNLKDTGIDIKNKRITLTADNVLIRNNAGVQTAVIDAQGKLTTSLINTKELVSQRFMAADSSGKIISSWNIDGDGAHIIYKEDKPLIRYGYERFKDIDGTAKESVVQAYNADGTIRWRQLINGSIFTQQLPYSWTVMTVGRVSSESEAKREAWRPTSTLQACMFNVSPNDSSLGPYNGRVFRSNLDGSTPSNNNNWGEGQYLASGLYAEVKAVGIGGTYRRRMLRVTQGAKSTLYTITWTSPAGGGSVIVTPL